MAAQIAPSQSLALSRQDLLCDGNYIAGKWQPARSLARYAVADPADDNVFAHVPDSASADATDAVLRFRIKDTGIGIPPDALAEAPVAGKASVS